MEKSVHLFIRNLSRLFLMVCIGFLPLKLNAQTTETFESATVGNTSFTSNSVTFTLSGGIAIDEYATYGYLSSNRYIDSYNSGGISSCKITSGTAFRVKSLYLYPSTYATGDMNQTSGVNVTFTGKLAGTTKFTYTPPSSDFTAASWSNTTNRGFSLVNFATPGYDNTTIDELDITLNGGAQYCAIDNYTWAVAPPLPTVTSISPTSGPNAGSTSVTINGTNLLGATVVKFGSTNATGFTVNSASQITATSPAGSAGAVYVTVTTSGGTSANSSQFTYVAAPTVSSISPTSGPTTGSTSVTITGTNLSSATGVKFGITNATGYIVNSATQITATSPAGSVGTVDVTVTTTGGTSATSSSDQFTYIPATSTWTGTGNWSTAGNWGSGLPGSITNATISTGTCTVDADATVTNLTVSPGAALTISSGKTLTVTGTLTLDASASGIASLINNGTITATNTIVKSFLTKNVWHVVSSPTSLEQIGSFITDNAAYIQSKGSSPVYYAVMNYNEGTNTWNKGTSYFTTASSTTFGAGIGYGVLPIAANDVTISYKGSLTNATASPPITRTGYGWNCVGNPYPASLNISESTGTTFLSQNTSSNLDPSYACVYVWNSSSSTYQIIGTVPSGFTSLSQNSVAPGQGFFVKAKTGSSSVTITPAMQIHNTSLALKATRAPWPAIRLKVANSTDSATTLFAFNSNMSKGLDPSFDAGLFRGSETIDLYSHLVKDNGVDFAIQCLPEAYDSLAIPLGVDYKTGGKLTFSAESADLPTDCKLILEDKTTGTFTSLANGASYSATVDANAAGTGRFFLHTSSTINGNSNGTTAVDDLTKGESLKVYAVRKVVYITGSNLSGSTAKLYDLNGRSYGIHKLTSDNTQTLDVSNLSAGIYMVRIANANGTEKSFKVMLME